MRLWNDRHLIKNRDFLVYYCGWWCFLRDGRGCKRPMNRDGTAAGGITAALKAQKFDDEQRIWDEQLHL